MTVKQIDNLLALLEYFAEVKEPATLNDVVRHFGWPRSSAFNILSTLVASGYLYEPRARGGFYPSPRWMQVVSAISEAEPMPEALVRIVQRLAGQTGETVWVSAPSGTYAAFLYVIESHLPVRYAATSGNRVPMHVTASGQALLSQLPERDAEVLLRRVGYDGYGPSAPKSLEETREQIRVGRQRGWFRSASNYSPDLGGVAVPVVIGNRAYAITVAGPLFRVEVKAEEHAILIYRAIAEELGKNHSLSTLSNIQVME